MFAKEAFFYLGFRYWDLRGRVNPIRMLLHYVGEDFEDKRYKMDDFSEWFEKDKVSLQGTLDFPNMPYYMDEVVKLSQVCFYQMFSK